MFKNYLKTAWRSILKARGFSFLNIAGLAIGLAVCLLILLFVAAELSYDSFHANADRAYRIQRAWLAADGSISSEFSTLAPSFVPLLRNDFPEIEKIARIWSPGNLPIRAGEKVFTEPRLFFAEPEIFEVFSLPMVKGDGAAALREPGNVILSRSMAEKFFGGEEPVGKILTVTLFRDLPYQVAGVMEDVPSNSHIHFDFLVSYISLGGIQGGGDNDYFLGVRNFSDNVTGVYGRLGAGVDVRNVEAGIPAFLDRHLPAETDEQGKLVKPSSGQTLHFRKMKDIHLYSRTRNEYEPGSDIRIVVLFTVIAVFILVIACVNFMNLATARASKRAKEVGLRQVVGAARQMLTVQFLAESYLVTSIALGLALVITAAAAPAFGKFSGRDIGIGTLLAPQGLILLLAGFAFTGLAAGLYPAFYLSSFRPGTILRGELTRGKGGAALRKALVVFQFAVSIGLIFSVNVISRQMNYLRTRDLGYARENVLLIPLDSKLVRSWTDVKTALLREKNIQSATVSKRAPAGRLLDAPGFWAEVNGQKVQSPFSMPHNRVEHDFFRTYGMDIIAGRDFSIDYPTDASQAFILNETAVRRLGFKTPEEAVGIRFGTYAPNREGRIIGVVRDFHYESLHQAIVPIVSYVAPNQATNISLRIAPGSLGQVVRHAQEVVDQYSGSGPLKYEFLDERLAALYRNEERTMKMFTAFSLLAILIGCLGLFGLAAYSAERRTKELGVRKVLGATAPNLFAILSKEFVKWVIAANAIAWPAAYFGMTKWLQNFAYRTEIGPLPFVLSAVLAFAIALITVTYQSAKSAFAEPVKALRYE